MCIPLFFGNRVLLFSDDFIIFELSGVSSFNQFIHELSVDSDTESVADSITGDDDNEEFVCPPSPLSQSSRLSHASSFSRRDRRLRRHIIYAVSWILWPLKFFISLLLILFNAIKYRIVRSSAKSAESPHLSRNSPGKRSFHIRDQFLQRTTDRRRGVFEVVFEFLVVSLFTWQVLMIESLFKFSYTHLVFINLLGYFFSHRISIWQLRFSLNQSLTLFTKEHIIFSLLQKCGRSYFAGFMEAAVTIVLLLMYQQLMLAVIIQFQLRGKLCIVILWIQIPEHVRMLLLSLGEHLCPFYLCKCWSRDLG